MDVVTTSLEALIQRITNPQNQKPDIAAIEAFCVMLTKETEGIQIGIKLLVTQIQSLNESEALQALSLLDTCMKRCGPLFHAEIGKFRFLNEMIKLVSPKYLGNRTTANVRQKVLQLLYAWITEYPRESKIKEAYEMLKKQGVIEEDAAFIMTNNEERQKSSKMKNNIFENEEMSRHLRRLLHSKDPSDLQTANRLIKFMVKEDEERLQLNSQRGMELESVQNNVMLLSEMLDSYNQNETSAEDLELMKELYQACERLKPILLRLASETQGNIEMLGICYI
ncbi:ADP-ribosylation factor-binding protein GGA3-like [Pogonomyrmex barbatus]|uniref:ADP-ribosylation factor-binding protein GGA3-like n=1 Tax=Pogonomyrmex barbatus TaxID=144034 RepID=A0A6I9WIS4_9HYME|nr:ADP-ribosylation factor-binding protein GGA3-like [Pogonomyrmex barbatus]XP_011631615.1 ADP-ribosylation factor-binding protein GGA3-like [Pogonomyrmex barbatus]